ncbi:uncharacterized protein CHSO_1439 [Chryseobacterium sp. StRB126]|uniref:hypothetical protein n=1 Tax=Chryseobacterium sp. StRB126 TaxID=878220 RepID=UPI0004E986FE|nr:hypothetical protein [Chryseobacterium sp. StRB126]BAP30476.1 uncharacterized protein CHSO_1439 [Chryseobacterium sp. StRB126]
MKIIFFLIILFLGNNTLYSQDKIKLQKSIDSLVIVLHNKDFITKYGYNGVLKICTEIYNQSKSIGYDKGTVNGILGMVGVYIEQQNFEKALKILPEGLAISEKAEDYSMWSNLLLMEGTTFAGLGYDKKSRKSLNKALYIIDHFHVEKDKYFIKSSVYNIIALNMRENSRSSADSIRFYLQKAYNESKKIEKKKPDDILRIAAFTLNLALACIDQNKLTEAEKYLHEFEGWMKYENNKSYFIFFYEYKGKIENKKRNYEKALRYFNKSIQFIHEYDVFSQELKEIYNGVSESYLGLKDYKNQALYLSKVQKITDSISAVEKKTLDNTISKQGKTENNTNDKTNYIISTVLFFMSICTTIFFVFNKKYRDRTNQKNRILTVKEINLPEQKKQDIDIKNLKELIELAKSNDKSFHLKFSEAFSTFNQRLLEINPQLTYSDLEYCALIKLKFDTKEIATFKNISISSVVSKKYRIRKKLNISTDENMYIWMLNID